MAKPRRPNPDAPAWWSTDEWVTPPEVVQEYADRFATTRDVVEGTYVFDLDPCAREETCQAQMYFDRTQDGLRQGWFGCVWVNPPYSNPGLWCQKMVKEIQAGRVTRGVMLLPPSVDTDWFHDWVLPYATIEYRRGRISFIGWMGTSIPSPRQGNLVAIYPKLP